MKIYIDIEDGFKCHVSNESGTMLEFEEPSFEGKCAEFIEGHRCKPVGYTWKREDGEVFSGGKMIAPWKDSDELYRVQAEYEHELLLQYEAVLSEINTALEEGE